MQSVATGTCGGCGLKVEFHLSPKPQIVNLESVSLVVVEHSGPIACPHCTLTLQPVLTQLAGAMVQLVPVRTGPESNLVIPAGNGRVS